MKVYVFYYNDMIYESSYASVSLHRTKAGAYKAMRKYIYQACMDHQSMFRRRSSFGRFEAWYVGELNIED